jgi:DtxR family Mn-dependent transcriptional regulator
MPSSAAEDYLRRIYGLSERSNSKLVSMGALAERVGVAPGSATAMVKKLASQGLVSYEPYSGVELTLEGRRLALGMIRRHRLIEIFLVETLGLDWSEIDAEAERLEHAISDRVLDRLDVLLGRPSIDPHGDPVPDADGHIRATSKLRLSACEGGALVRVVRVYDQDPEFLKYVSFTGLRPGVQVRVVARDEPGQALSVQPAGGETLTLGLAAAEKLAVEMVALRS